MFLSHILKMFQARGKQVISRTALAFSDQAISLACFDENQKLTCCVFIPNDEKMLETLQKVVIQKNLKQLPCVCVLNPTDYQSFLFEKPEVTSGELLDAIRWRLIDLIDYPLMSAKLDFIDVPTRHHESHKMIYVIAANKAHIQHAQDTARAAGLVPVEISIPELALSWVFLNIASPQKTKVLVSFQEHTSQLVIYKHDTILFMRRFQVGLSSLKVSQEKFVQEVALEIQRSLDYCSANLMDTSNAMVYLSGIIDVNPICTALEDVIGLPVYPFKAEHVAGLNDKVQPNIINYSAIGAALSGLIS